MRSRTVVGAVAVVALAAVLLYSILSDPDPSVGVNGTVFGTSPADDAPASEVQFNLPEDAIEAPDGTIYVSEAQSHVIKTINRGTVSVFAGTFEAGYNGDGPRLKTQLNLPTSLQFTADGKAIVFADSGNYLIRRVDLATGQVTTLAGEPGNSSQPIDGSTAKGSPIGYVAATRLDSEGNLWFPTYTWSGPDHGPTGGGIFRLDPAGILHRHAVPVAAGDLTLIRDLNLGPGYLEFTRGTAFVRVHDDGTVQTAKLGSEFGKGIVRISDSATLVGDHTKVLSLDKDLDASLVVDGFANVANIRKAKSGYLITDSDQGVLFRYNNSAKQQLTGGSTTGYGALTSVAEYGDNSVLVLDNQRPRIFLLDLTTGKSELWAGTGAQAWATPGVDKLRTSFYYPNAIAVDSEQNVYVLEQHRIMKISGFDHEVSRFAGDDSGGDRDATGTAARFRSPAGIAVDPSGDLIVADTYNSKIRKVTRDGVVTTIAGTGVTNPPTFGRSAKKSALNRPNGVLALPDGRVLVADSWNNAVYAIDEEGVIHPFAGKPMYRGYQGRGSFSGDGGRAIVAGLNTPVSLAVDAEGTVYISDRFNNRIRAVTKSGVISTLAGGSAGFAPRGKLLNSPAGITVLDNQLLVADTGNKIIVRYWLT